MSKQKAIEVDCESPKHKAVEADWKSEDALEDFHKIMKAEFAVRGPSHAKWHEYCKEQTDAIMMRIAVSFFGDHGPEHVEQGLLKITDVLHSYNDKQQAFVNKIFKRLMKLLGKGSTIYISRVMIGRVDKEGISYCYIMAVRVGESSDGTIPRTYFIDHVARTYNSWSDFLKNNRLPYGFIIYPRHGKYSLDGTTGDYVLDAGWNKSRFPAAISSTTSRKSSWDRLAFGVVGAAVCVASIFFPPLCGYHLVAGGFVKLSAIWGGARCGYGIFDNVMHGQSVLGRESIPLWGGLLAAFLGFGTAYCLTGGVLGDASVLAKVAGYRLSVKILGAVAVAAGAPLANAAAVGFVGDGRLAPQHEAVVIAMSVYAATNILLSNDQAHQIRMIVSEDGASAEGVSVEKVGKLVEDLFRKAGLRFDAPELPFIAANEICKVTGCLNEMTANDVLQRFVKKCQNLKLSLAGSGQNATIPAVTSGQDQTPQTDEKHTD